MTATTNFETRLNNTSKLMNILVADDHYANRLLSQSLLQREGHVVTLANDGKEAVKACTQQIFDLILLDIQMPILNGIEALTLIKTLGNGNEKIPIFALTAHSHNSEIRTILNKGFEAVLQKPFRISDMMLHLDRPYKNMATTNISPKRTQNNGQIYLDVMKLPLLETQTLDILLGAIGQDRMCRVLQAYWNDANTMMQRLKSTRLNVQSAIKLELIELRKTAHGLKGASANIGLLKASRLAAQLQNAPIEDIPYLIETLERTLLDSQSVIRDYCGLIGSTTAPEFAVAS